MVMWRRCPGRTGGSDGGPGDLPGGDGGKAAAPEDYGGYGVLAAATEVWVLASGAGKEQALKESVLPEGKTPLARVLRSRAAGKRKFSRILRRLERFLRGFCSPKNLKEI